MDSFTLEVGLRRGVLYWWLFCLLLTVAGLLELSGKSRVTLALGIPPLVAALTHYVQQPARDAVRQRSYFVLNAVSVGFGFVLYAMTAVILPTWNCLLKLFIFTCTVQALIKLAKMNSDSERIWGQLQWLNQIPTFLNARATTALQLGNPVIRLPAVMLAYAALFLFLASAVIFSVNYDFPLSHLPWLRMSARMYRLRVRSFLFHHVWKRYVDYHVYNPIEDQSGETQNIRLLRLKKRRPFGEIQCQLVVKDLREGPAYDAISYHWGNGEKSEPIFVDGRVMLVSPTVMGVLYHLSSYKEDRYVWIDSICINQLDNEEKSSQISLMRDIYSKASNTVVWLDGVSDTFKARSMLAGLWYEYTYGTVDSCFRLLRQYSETHVEAGWMQLINLFANPWFFRVWVIQEIAMASSVVVLASGEHLVWEHLSTVAEMMASQPFNMVLQSGHLVGLEEASVIGLLHICVMVAFRRDMDSSRPDLLHLLNAVVSFRSTEAVDRVYALLGLLDPADDVHQWLKADYSKRAEQVYTLVAQYYIRNNANDVLSNAGMGYERNLSTIPSWVPDWTALSMHDTRRQRFTKTSLSARYNATADSPLEVEFRSSSSDMESTLYIRGHCFDTVSHVGPTLTYLDHNRGLPGEDDNEDLLKCLQQHMGARRLATTFARDPYPTGQSVEEAFWRCLIGDTQFKRPAPAELGVYCRLWERAMVSRLDGAEAEREGLRDDTNTLPSMEQLKAGGLEVEALRCGFLWNSARIMACAGRALAITRNGYMAMVPPGSVPGDAVCVLYGLATPYVVRLHSVDERGGGLMRETDTEGARLVGEAYVHGVMDGEAMNMSANRQMFKIV
ncbi:hypothetical protein DL764_000191 [Monosporascus ibericus]|uniref:Heterokaryon incompatibility domain-containing protein n=1 Tax=Monosporascus ibericus TaxID=155417 RepID=A0A4Q4TUK3_9PEZI|nr:hypothetical protein DL764_000191 [Monosporascus ibericus]